MSVLIDHGNEWSSHLPMKAKALALSAFLASRNPSTTDRSTFGQATKGRRKKTKDPGGNSQEMIGGSLPQAFSVERLLSIYHQLLPSLHAAIADMPCNKYRRIRNRESRGESDKKVSIFSVDDHKTHQYTKNETLLYTMVRMIYI